MVSIWPSSVPSALSCSSSASYSSTQFLCLQFWCVRLSAIFACAHAFYWTAFPCLFHLLSKNCSSCFVSVQMSPQAYTFLVYVLFHNFPSPFLSSWSKDLASYLSLLYWLLNCIEVIYFYIFTFRWISKRLLNRFFF